MLTNLESRLKAGFIVGEPSLSMVLCIAISILTVLTYYAFSVGN